MSADIQAVPMEKTSEAGNPKAGSAFNFPSTKGPVKWAQACWNGEVIKGVAIKFYGDDKMYTAGDWNNGHENFHISFVDLGDNDLLSTTKILTTTDLLSASQEPGFGYGSVRGIEVVTRQTQWTAGNTGDTQTLNVRDRSWMGIFGSVNSDQFINSLGFWITTKK